MGLRVIFKNEADSATSLVADSTAPGGNLIASNMQSDIKGKLHRSVGLSVQYTLTWTDGVTIGALGMPAHNLSATATQRMRLYQDAACTVLLVDSGIDYACPGINFELLNWARPINGNAFAYGGASMSAIWLGGHYFAKGCKINLSDPDNEYGAIDNSRLVIGPVWEPVHTASFGSVVRPIDTTKNTRNGAGDLLPDLGTQHDECTLDLRLMPEADRAEFRRIVRRNGVSQNLFLSLFPGDANPIIEQDGMFYGKRQNDGISFDLPGAFSTKYEMEGW